MIARALFLHVILVALLVACAGGPGPNPEEMEPSPESVELVEVGTRMFGDLIAEKARLEGVAYRLNRAARSYCGELQRPLAGALLGGQGAVSKDWKREAGKRQGIGELLTILHIVPGSGFDRSGLRVGDQLVSFGEHAPRTRSEFGEILLRGAGLERVEVVIVREGEQQSISVDLDLGCPIPFELAAAPNIIATRGARGLKVIAPRGLLRYTDDDDRLAAPLAHQLAHTLLRLGDDSGLAGERQADRLGVRLAAAAGYDISHTVPYWEDTARAYPWLITPERPRGSRGSRGDQFRRLLKATYDHHDLARRMAGIRSAVDEVQALLDRHAKGQ